MDPIAQIFTQSTIDFSTISDSNPRLPKLNTADAVWKAQVCENARKIYLAVKYSRIPCVKESKTRSPLSDDDDDDDEDACDTPLSSATTDAEPEQQVSKENDVSSDLEAELAQLQDKLKQVEERSRRLEDENSLLAWYAHHLRNASSESGDLTVDSILDEAKMVVLEQALATIDEAAAISDTE